MKNFWDHIKKYIFRGFLATIPIFLSYYAIKFFYVFVDQKVMNLIDGFIGMRIPGLGLIVFLFVLYIIGMITKNFIGKQLFGIVESITNKIPIIKTTYQVGKQLSSTLSLPEQQVFKKAVLVDFFREGLPTIGFITGQITNEETGEKLFKVFVPTVPNPTTGFVAFARESQVTDPGWTIDEAIRTVISGGIIGPDKIKSVQKFNLVDK